MPQVAGQAAQAVLDRNQSLAVMAMPDKQSIAQQALGGQAGGTYLAPALYKPVLQAHRDPPWLVGDSQLLVGVRRRIGPRRMPRRRALLAQYIHALCMHVGCQHMCCRAHPHGPSRQRQRNQAAAANRQQATAQHMIYLSLWALRLRSLWRAP